MSEAMLFRFTKSDDDIGISAIASVSYQICECRGARPRAS